MQGDIVSGGMDGKLCLWPGESNGGGGAPGGVQAHAGSIAAIKADVEGRVVSCGYGGALRIWDCRSGRCRGGGRQERGAGGQGKVENTRPPYLVGELYDERLPAPCMDFAWSSGSRGGGGSVVTGHRDGRLGFYDLETGAMLMCVDKAHRGHVTTLSNLGVIGNSSNCSAALGRSSDGGQSATEAAQMGATGGGQGCFITGGQDGFVRVWDTRVGGPSRSYVALVGVVSIFI